MTYRACFRCGSSDLGVPSTEEGVLPQQSLGALWTCLRCGYVGAPMTFEDREAHAAFQREREALYHPEAQPLPTVRADEPAKGRSALTRGLAALLAFVFLTAALLAFLTAAQVGGNAWFTVAPAGVFALLLGVPFAALARRS